MWYPATVTTPAAAEPVTLDDAKRQSRITYEDDDDYLGSLISAARDHVENYCNLRLVTQTISVKCDVFNDLARFPVAPLQSVTSITYTDPDGNAQTLADTVYETRSDGIEAAVVLKYGQVWPVIRPTTRITVTAVVGYAATPAAITHAMLLYVAAAYEQRENAADAPWSAFDSLLSNFRRGA